MGCSMSRSDAVVRRQSAQHIETVQWGTYHRFPDQQHIEEQIANKDSSQPLGEKTLIDRITPDKQHESRVAQKVKEISPTPTKPTEPQSSPRHTKPSLTPNKKVQLKEIGTSDRLDLSQDVCLDDPVLNKLFSELRSIKSSSTTNQNVNKRKKLQSKIDRYQLSKKNGNNSQIKKKHSAKLNQQTTLSLNGKDSSDCKMRFLVNQVLCGKMTSACPTNVKIVRIFTSSTFTDTKYERNYLMEKVYPKLKVFCLQRGYQFQVVDMRWGIRDEATHDHMTTDLCLQELEICQNLSTGPNFVSFLSHKYGYRPCPRTICKEQFEKFLEAANFEDKTLMLRWYFQDKNTLKCLYILQPVGDILSDINSTNNEAKEKAKDQWWKESERLRHIISSLAKQILSEEEARRFLMSVTEIEIAKGILNVEDVENRCLWFKRNIQNIENQKYDDDLKKFRECPKISEDFKESQELLENLKDERMLQKLPLENISSYDIAWAPGGVDPDSNEGHREYLKKLGQDFEQRLKDLIEKSISKKDKEAALNDPLYEEVEEHTLFCQKKCESFSGRHDSLQKIKNYVQGERTHPLVIYGKSGCGKTSIMAKAAMSISDWLNDKAIVILRFIGTTLSSSDANSLMISIIQQIQYIFSCPQQISADNKILEKQFHEHLAKGSEENPIILILDSLDQLNILSEEQRISWLITDSLPPNTKVILSTLPEKQYACLQELQSWITDESLFWEVPRLPLEDVGAILSQWLGKIGRTLTGGQRSTVIKAFEQCPTPLFLKLSFDVARGWHSYSPLNLTVLETTVKDSISNLFNRLEVKHGRILVSHALGYLTLAEDGLSEQELEDILSCDEEVLNDVYMYWTPPIRRLPPLLLVRIKNDIQEYLVNRGSDGVQVIHWYHRQFIEAATEIYCSDNSTNEMLYSGLVDYFSGKWANGVLKPFVDKSGKSGECDRLVTQQPIKFENAPNLRKLNNLPHLLVQAKMVNRLKKEVLFNFEFLLTKMKAASVRKVLDDFLLACESFPQDEAIHAVTEALQLSQDALTYDSGQFFSQLIGRLFTDLPELQLFIESCRNSKQPYLEANNNVLVKPGGQLIHCIPAHKGEITSFDVSSDKRTAVSLCMEEGCIKFWDPRTGQKLPEYSGFENNLAKVQFCLNDKLVAINPDTRIVFLDTKTVSFSHDLDIKNFVKDCQTENRFFQVCGQNKELILIHNQLELILCEIKSNRKRFQIHLSEEEASVIDPGIQSTGSEKLVVLSLATEPSKILILNLNTCNAERLNCDQLFYNPDSYPSGLALCPKTDLLYFSGLEEETLFCFDAIKMEIVKTFPGRRAVPSENFRISSEGKFIYYIADDTMKVWDLNLGTNRTVLAENGLLLRDIGIISEKLFITTSPDPNLRIWDLSRNYKAPEVKKKVPSGHVNHGSVQEIKFLKNSRYFLFMIGFGPFYWYFYDTITCEILVEFKLTGCEAILIPLSDLHFAVVSESRKLKVINLQTCSISQVFKGKVNPSSCFLQIKNGKEILTTSYGRKNLKVYNTETGQTHKIIKGNGQTISYISVNQSNSIAIAFTKDDCVLVVDLIQYKTLHELMPNNFESCHGILVNQELFQISNDGNLIILMVKKYLDASKDSVFCTIIWNIKQEKIHCHMLDEEYHKRYKEDCLVDMSLDVESALFMHNDQAVLSTHDDCIIRVFSATTGDLQKRISQYSNTVPKVLFSPNENLPYFVSWVASDEEKVFCLWRSETFEKITSLKLDEKPKIMALSPSGDVVIGRGKTEDQPITLWKLKNDVKEEQVFSQMKSIDIFKKHEYENTIEVTQENDDDDNDDEDDDIDDEEEKEENKDNIKSVYDLESFQEMYKNFIN